MMIKHDRLVVRWLLLLHVLAFVQLDCRAFVVVPSSQLQPQPQPQPQPQRPPHYSLRQSEPSPRLSTILVESSTYKQTCKSHPSSSSSSWGLYVYRGNTETGDEPAPGGTGNSFNSTANASASITSTLNDSNATTTTSTATATATQSAVNDDQTTITATATTTSITNETESASSPTQSTTATPTQELQQLQQPQQQQQYYLRELYPPSVAYQTGTLQVDAIHTLYYEVHGGNNRNATLPNATFPNTTSSTTSPPKKSALFLHGGPGAGCFPTHARFFNPALYDTIVLLDQRGCGKSTPQGQIFNNTLLHVVQDCEALRQHLLGPLGVWDVVLGGSWGSTVAVAYVQEYPTRVRSVILRGVCLLRPQEVDWLFTPQGGASQQAPEAWQRFCDTVVGMGPTFTTQSQTTTTPKPKRPLPIMAPDQGTGLGERVVLGNPARNTFLDKTRTNPQQQQHQQQQPTNTNNNIIDRSVLHAYYDRLFGRNTAERWMAARGWMAYESAVSSPSSFQKNQTKTQPQPQPQPQQQQEQPVPNETSSNTNPPNETTTNATTTEMPPKSPAVLVSDASSDRWSFQDLEGKVLSPIDVASLVGLNDPAHYANTRLRRGLPLSPRSSSSSSSPPRPIGMTIHDFDPESSSSQQESVGNVTGFPALPMLTCFYSTNEQYATNYMDLLSPERMNRIAHIPCIAVQGGRDPICPPDTALELKKQWPAMELRIPLDAGHSMYHPELTHELVQATDRLATQY